MSALFFVLRFSTFCAMFLVDCDQGFFDLNMCVHSNLGVPFIFAYNLNCIFESVRRESFRVFHFILVYYFLIKPNFLYMVPPECGLSNTEVFFFGAKRWVHTSGKSEVSTHPSCNHKNSICL